MHTKSGIKIQDLKIYKRENYGELLTFFFYLRNVSLEYICGIVRHSGNFPDSSRQSAGMFQNAG